MAASRTLASASPLTACARRLTGFSPVAVSTRNASMRISGSVSATVCITVRRASSPGNPASSPECRATNCRIRDRRT